MKRFRYATSCVESNGDAINEMRHHSAMQNVSYRTMLKHCDGLLDWAEEHGYDLWRNAADSHGLTLRDDWAVSYHKSFFENRRCYYLVWSGIEHIWVEG